MGVGGAGDVTPLGGLLFGNEVAERLDDGFVADRAEESFDREESLEEDELELAVRSPSLGEVRSQSDLPLWAVFGRSRQWSPCAGFVALGEALLDGDVACCA